MPADLRAGLAEASSILSSLAPIPSEAVDAAPDDLFEPLRHELSAHYLALHIHGQHARRSGTEVVVLKEFEVGLGTFLLLAPSDFREQLVALNHSLADGKGGWRTGFVKLAEDRAGNQIYFPPVSAVPGQIEKLRLFLADRAGNPPLFKAAIALALLLNCHPFTDGNGRTARLLFNHLLRRGGMPDDVYLPMYEIARRSHGGYEIALRMAELHGAWAPLLRWTLDMIRCCRDLTAAPTGTVSLSSD